MKLEELKIRVSQLCEDLNCTSENIGAVIGGLKKQIIDKALSGEDERVAKIIEDFFNSRDYAFSVYSDEQRKLIKEFEKRIVEKGSASNALQGTKISPSTMSSIRKAKYNGDVEAKFRELKIFLDLKGEASKVYKNNDYIPTSISECIYENIRTAHIQGVCIMVTGDAGIGKTEAGKQYIRNHQGNAVMITAVEPKTNKTAMLELLAKALNIDLSETKRSAYTQKMLSEINDGTVIIVDEAQNFKFDAIDTLRGFSDYFKDNNLGTVGIVCMGNDTFRQQFFGKSGIGKEQVWNRFVERPRYETKNIPFRDIELMFPILKEQGMIKELRFLYIVALSPKEDIRSAVHLFTTMYNRGRYDFDSLVKQAKNMQIDLSNMPQIMKALERR